MPQDKVSPLSPRGTPKRRLDVQTSMDTSGKLSPEFMKRAEDELNETPENVQQGTEDLRRMILGRSELLIYCPSLFCCSHFMVLIDQSQIFMVVRLKFIQHLLMCVCFQVTRIYLFQQTMHFY